MPDLDPHDSNQLGKGIIDPAVEARMIARGIVWARQLHSPGEYPPAYHCITSSFHSESKKYLRDTRRAFQRNGAAN